MKTSNLFLKFNKETQQALKLLLVFFYISIFLTSCETNDDLPIQSNVPIFNLNLFEQNIINSIDPIDNPIAWSYTINVNGNLARSNAFGQARTVTDGALDFTLNQEINVASITKLYTAIGAMQLLEANGLTIDDKIINWLPSSWLTGTGVDNLSFKDLLKHESGLNSTNNNFNTTLSYQGLKNCIREGVVNSKARNYLNVNFALFRVLIPSLWNALPNNETIDIESDENTQNTYLTYMQQHLFDKISLPDVGCNRGNTNLNTLYYNINDADSNSNGLLYPNWENKSGGGGYFMTPIEMAKVIAFFEHTEELVTEEQRNIMKLHRLGMDKKYMSDELHGSYYGKGGSIDSNSDPSLSKGVLTQMVMFPINGIDCVIVMNTRGVKLNGQYSLRKMIYDAYNNAWE